jgi:FMN phosphatase YigB (HAD superfamily)
LSAQVADALAALRRRGWRIGILTNGPPDVERRKIGALGLSWAVDAVVFATEHGEHSGKPDDAPFHEIARRLRVDPADVVYVGDDERCDIAGAMAVGMTAIRCLAWRATNPDTAARVAIRRFESLPDLAQALLEETTAHVA